VETLKAHIFIPPLFNHRSNSEFFNLTKGQTYFSFTEQSMSFGVFLRVTRNYHERTGLLSGIFVPSIIHLSRKRKRLWFTTFMSFSL